MLEDPEFADLSTEELTQIDMAVSRYESQRRGGALMDIDECVAESPTALKAVLQRELVRAEAEILADWGDAKGLARLATRWPTYAELIRVASEVTPTQVASTDIRSSRITPSEITPSELTDPHASLSPAVPSEHAKDVAETHRARALLAIGMSVL